jgi:hypothetical protein
MNVLVACEESQEVCKAFRSLGHRAFSADLQECSGGHPEWHIQGDVLPIINGDCTFMTADTHTHTQSGQWDLLIAHPPCTYLTNAGAVRLFKNVHDGNFQMVNVERLKKGMQARNFFMEILHADCDKIAIENPVPTAIYMLPAYTQIIEPYMFGDPYKKKTCLWLKNLPMLKPTNVIHHGIVSWVSGGSKKADGTPRENIGMFSDSKIRSKTFPGVARAMAEQWTQQYMEQIKFDF